MSNGRCRLHGGKSSGCKTVEGKKKIELAGTVHGFYASSAIQERKILRKMIQQARSVLAC